MLQINKISWPSALGSLCLYSHLGQSELFGYPNRSNSGQTYCVWGDLLIFPPSDPDLQTYFSRHENTIDGVMFSTTFCRDQKTRTCFNCSTTYIVNIMFPIRLLTLTTCQARAGFQRLNSESQRLNSGCQWEDCRKMDAEMCALQPPCL